MKKYEVETGRIQVADELELFDIDTKEELEELKKSDVFYNRKCRFLLI